MNAEFIIEKNWKKRLASELDKGYMQELRRFLNEELEQGKVIYPPVKEYFNALNLTPFEDVKVVILGQDPYHGEGQAQGLCFSVPKGTRVPPSLVNIYKELATDLNIEKSENGCLIKWAEQGVLLLNSVLTVEAKLAGSHQGKGWETFTDKIIKLINDEKEHVVFLLWGSYAQKKCAFIDESKHMVIKSVHPSPLSAHRGFFGQKYFSKTNDYLKLTGQEPVQWSLN